MKYRNLGKTGIKVSEVEFGAWGIGGTTPGATSYGDTNDEDSVRALETAFEGGVTFYDTANVYGAGHSEGLLKTVFSNRRDDVVLATKVGCIDYQAPLDFSAKNIRFSLEGSLKRLGTDYVDVLMLHDPLPNEHLLDESLAELLALKKSGKIRAMGISVRNPEDINQFLKKCDIDAFQVNLNLMDQRVIDSDAMDHAHRSGSAIIARTPLCFGFLSDRFTGTVQFDPPDHRSRWPEQQIRLWQDGCRFFTQSLAKEKQQSVVQVALRYCLSHKAVSTVIPDIMTTDEAIENLSASDLGPLSDSELSEISKIYSDHTFFNERPTDKLAMADK